METYTIPLPVPTEIIRVPADGPKPLNTLAFIRCDGRGGAYTTSYGDLLRYRVKLTSMFAIDGFTQANLPWYEANTRISATAFVQVLNATTDIEFVYAVDQVEPFIAQDGKIGFEVQLAQQVDGLGLFETDVETSFSYKISAYILLFEPKPPTLPPAPPAPSGGTVSYKERILAREPVFGRRKTFLIADDPMLKWKREP